MRVSSQDVRLDLPDPKPQELVVKRQMQEGAIQNMEKQMQESVQRAESQNKVNSEEVRKLLEEIRSKFDMLSKYLRIEIDSDLEIPVAKIMERDTNRVIRQIPPDYLLELIKRIDQMLGVLLEKEA